MIIVDSSLQDGIELSGPLEEWLSTVSLQADDLDLEKHPPFIDPEDWNPKTSNRAWVWQNIPKVGLRLVHKVSSMEMLAKGVRTHNSGLLPRDEAQRAGLALIEGRPVTSLPLSNTSILAASRRDISHMKREILPDQYQRPVCTLLDISHYEEGEIFPFEDSGKMIRTSDYRIIPNEIISRLHEIRRSGHTLARSKKRKKILGIEVKEKKKILGIDPRPIVPSSTKLESLDQRIGLGSVRISRRREFAKGVVAKSLTGMAFLSKKCLD